jgi:hypothetical protein
MSLCYLIAVYVTVDPSAVFGDTLNYLSENLSLLTVHKFGPESSVGIATDYGARRSGDRIPVGDEIFRACPDWPWSPPSFLYNDYRVFPGGKERPERDADPSPPSSAVGHERVELYIYFPCGPYGLYRASVPVQGCTLPYSKAIPLLPL